MEILVFNLETTFLKYKLFGVRKIYSKGLASQLIFKLLKHGRFDNLGENRKMRHEEAIRQTIRKIGNLTNIGAIIHRLVYGGNDFLHPVTIGPVVLKKLEQYNELLSSYNKYSILGVKTCLAYFGSVPNIAVFDTAFFKDLPLKSKVYPLPFDFYHKYGIEKFGFRGIAHRYLVVEAARRINKSQDKIKLIIIELGSNYIITAVKDGKPIDTSSGFTPLEGLMTNRGAGDIDPGLIFELQKIKLKDNVRQKQQDLTALMNETKEILQFESGLKGISGSDNLLKILKDAKKYPRFNLAIEIFIYRIQKYLSAYWGILGGVDAIVFTGEIAQMPIIRKYILRDLKFLKRTKILSIKVDEELALVQESVKFLKI